jgi:hypothetical protein
METNKDIILLTEYFKSTSADRNNEIIECLQKNLKSCLFTKIIVFCEEKFIDEIKNIKNIQIVITNRLTYKYAFEYANNNFKDGTIIIFANNDIYFDDSLLKLNNVDMTNKCFALLRYEVLEDNSIKIHGPVIWSQDTWILQTPIKIPNKSNFFFGLPGCDNSILYLLRNEGYIVSNPCYDILTYHLHLSKVRNWTIAHTVPGPYAYANPSKL